MNGTRNLMTAYLKILILFIYLSSRSAVVAISGLVWRVRNKNAENGFFLLELYTILHYECDIFWYSTDCLALEQRMSSREPASVA